MFANIHFRVWGNVITIIVQNFALDIDALQFQITIVMQYNHQHQRTFVATFAMQREPLCCHFC